MHKKEIERLLKAMSEITSRAKSEGRDLTTEEQAMLRIYQSEYDIHQKALDDEAKAEETRKAAEAMLQRNATVKELFKSYGFETEAEEFLKKKEFTMEEAKSAVLDLIQKHGAPSASRITVGESGEDKYRIAAADALVMKGGLSLANPAEGARKMSNMSLKDLAIECLERGGQFDSATLRHMSRDEVFDEVNKRAYQPTSAFSAIMDSAVKKTLEEAYKEVPTTFQLFTTKGTLHDFKEDKDRTYIYGSGDRLLKVPENGELKQSTISTEALPTRKLETYGRQFSLTRQAFINDDIGLVLTVPAVYARMAKETINEQVYDILFKNGKVYDGKVLFDEKNHKNLAKTASKPTQSAIQSMILLMGKQTHPVTNKRIMNKPKFLITGVGYQFELATLFGSRYVPGSANNDINPLFDNPLSKNIIEEPYLNTLADAITSGEKNVPWFMLSDPLYCKGIQVDYLDGKETPTIRRNEAAPGTLGFTWDIFHDWGVFVADYKGIYRNNGAAIKEE